jgi:L-asparaginase/Glu-tRNA(Gln) amidotransferase subunit D
VAGGRGGATSYRLAGDDLQPLKARILLMLALTVTSDPGEVRRILSEY